MRFAGPTALITTLLLAFGGGTALAQSSPTERVYDESLGVLGEIQSEEPTTPSEQEIQPTPTPGTPPQTQREGDLPFTGLDLGIVALMGGILLATGLALRRSTRRSPTA